jgi:hypothetical protein
MRLLSPLIFTAVFAYASLSQSKAFATTGELLTRVSQDKSISKYTLGIGEESLFLRDHPPGGHSDETRVSGRLQLKSSEQEKWGASVDVSGSVSTGIGRESMWALPEAYVSWTNAPLNDSRASIALGRKKEMWSRLDSDWTLGLWQPFHRFDALRSIEQGMTGAFTGYRSGSFEILAFASPVFIPEQGPGFELEDGRFSTRNQWFSEPTDKLALFGKDTAIHYAIEMPEATHVVMHPEAGLLTRFGSQADLGSSLQLAIMKKPRNQLSLPFDGVLNITRDEAQVRFAPQVVYHNLASADVLYRERNWSMGLSGLADISDEPNAPKGYTFQRLQPLYLISPNYETKLFTYGYLAPQLKVSLLESIGGQVETQGPLSTDRDPFPPRVMYRRASSVELHSRIWQSATLKLEQSVKWIEEFSEHGRILMFDTSLISRDSWRMIAYLDVLASELPEDQNPGFISRFRGNDRVGTQLSFCF